MVSGDLFVSNYFGTEYNAYVSSGLCCYNKNEWEKCLSHTFLQTFFYHKNFPLSIHNAVVYLRTCTSKVFFPWANYETFFSAHAFKTTQHLIPTSNLNSSESIAISLKTPPADNHLQDPCPHHGVDQLMVSVDLTSFRSLSIDPGVRSRTTQNPSPFSPLSTRQSIAKGSDERVVADPRVEPSKVMSRDSVPSMPATCWVEHCVHEKFQRGSPWLFLGVFSKRSSIRTSCKGKVPTKSHVKPLQTQLSLSNITAKPSFPPSPCPTARNCGTTVLSLQPTTGGGRFFCVFPALLSTAAGKTQPPPRAAKTATRQRAVRPLRLDVRV